VKSGHACPVQSSGVQPSQYNTHRSTLLSSIHPRTALVSDYRNPGHDFTELVNVDI
jgi:hypothetical protein